MLNSNIIVTDKFLLSTRYMSLTFSKRVKNIYNSNSIRPSGLSILNKRVKRDLVNDSNQVNLMYMSFDSDATNVSVAIRRTIDRISKYI